jgi:hypothetical protein
VPSVLLEAPRRSTLRTAWTLWVPMVLQLRLAVRCQERATMRAGSRLDTCRDQRQSGLEAEGPRAELLR